VQQQSTNGVATTTALFGVIGSLYTRLTCVFYVDKIFKLSLF
jgi:hypothetical protein